MNVCVLCVVTFLAAISSCSCGCAENCTAEYLSAAMFMAPTFTEYATYVLSPVYAIVASGASAAVIQRKITWMCHIAQKFDSCMERCDDTRTGELRAALVGQLTFVCTAARTSRKAFEEYIRCEKEHYEQAVKTCPPHHKTENMLHASCSQLHQLSACYWGMHFKCSEAGVVIRNRIGDSQKQSHELLEALLARINVPFECMRATDAPATPQSQTKLRRGQLRETSQTLLFSAPTVNNSCCPELRFYGLLVVSPFILSLFYYFYSCCILYRLI